MMHSSLFAVCLKSFLSYDNSITQEVNPVVKFDNAPPGRRQSHCQILLRGQPSSKFFIHTSSFPYCTIYRTIRDMPHVSTRKVEQRVVARLEKYLYKLIRDSGSKTRLLIFEELLTKTEQTMFAKRIGILLLLRKGLSFHKIGELLGVSPSTVGRFKNHMDLNKYQHTVNWVWKNTKDGAFEDFITKLVSLAFTRRTKSFKKFLDEY